jgi:ribosomal protein S18 acetylase RimI-like enzyme
MTLRVERFADARAFLEVCEAHLLSAEVENALFLGVAHALRNAAEPPRMQPYLAAVFDGERLLCCAWRTVPDKIGASRTERSDALELLAKDAHEACPEGHEVLGPEPSVSELAARIAELRGTLPRKRMAQRIHSLTRVNELEGLPKGTLREANEGDLELGEAWMGAFLTEIGEPSPSQFRELAQHRIRTRGLYLWEQAGRVVSMAARTGKTPHGVRVSFVYTPPELRGSGYATACVSATSRLLLETGNDFVCLYTDLSNPTSNAIYRRIGYEPVCDTAVYAVG